MKIKYIRKIIIYSLLPIILLINFSLSFAKNKPYNLENKILNSKIKDINKYKIEEKITNSAFSSKTSSISLYDNWQNKLYMWGDNTYGQQGNGQQGGVVLKPTWVPIGAKTSWASDRIKFVAVSNNNSAVVVEDEDYKHDYLFVWGKSIGSEEKPVLKPILMEPININWGRKIKDLAVSDNSAAVIVEGADGLNHLWMWGDNTYGQQGNGTNKSVAFPEKVDLKNVTNVLVTDKDTAALTSDGKLYMWGDNSYQQQGISSKEQKMVLKPKEVKLNIDYSNVKIKRFDISSNSSGVIVEDLKKANNKLYMWGANNYGQQGNGEINIDGSLPSLVQAPNINWGEENILSDIKLSNNTSSVATSDGKLYMWGDNSSGQIGNGTDHKFETRPRHQILPYDSYSWGGNFFNLSTFDYNSILMIKKRLNFDDETWNVWAIYTWGSGIKDKMSTLSPFQITWFYCKQ